MDFKMDSGWRLLPIGGDTGSAYMGIRAEEKVFLKRNSSPFLAALSVEGITPRLIWTKRIGNGDILTAQEWLNGRALTHEEMTSPTVISILRHIHRSENLLSMLRKVKGEVYDPETFLDEYRNDLGETLKTNSVLKNVRAYLEKNMHYVKGAKYSVCHGDLNRKNFLLADTGRLYLVDWEMVKIADPLSDISLLLSQYLEPYQWDDWLDLYGIQKTQDVYMRLEWYSFMNSLLIAKRSHTQGNNREMNKQILFMKKLYETRIHSTD